MVATAGGGVVQDSLWFLAFCLILQRGIFETPNTIFSSAPLIGEQTRGTYWILLAVQRTIQQIGWAHLTVLNLLLWLIYERSSYLSFHLSFHLIYPILIKSQTESSLGQRIYLLCCFQSFLYSGALICIWKLKKILKITRANYMPLDLIKKKNCTENFLVKLNSSVFALL